MPTIASPLVAHCNPVQKTLPTGQVFPITDPNARLACFKITEPTQSAPTVRSPTSSAPRPSFPASPTFLPAVPGRAWTGPARETPRTPPGLNHLRVTRWSWSPGSNPAPVTLADEFRTSSATVNPVPVELCLPTRKIVDTKVFKIINPAMHLLCFPVSKTPIRNPVWDENQFGTSKVTIQATSTLCVPSTKKIG